MKIAYLLKLNINLGMTLYLFKNVTLNINKFTFDLNNMIHIL
jgi:hypothetical protein